MADLFNEEDIETVPARDIMGLDPSVEGFTQEIDPTVSSGPSLAEDLQTVLGNRRSADEAFFGNIQDPLQLADSMGAENFSLDAVTQQQPNTALVDFLSQGMGIGPGGGTVPMEVLDQGVASPSEGFRLLKEKADQGMQVLGPGDIPIDFDNPAFPEGLRSNIEGTFDTAAEKILFLKDVFDSDPRFDGYDVARLNSSNDVGAVPSDSEIMVYLPHTGYWHVVDPSGVFNSPQEVLSEIAENPETVLPAAAGVMTGGSSMLVGAAAEAGMGFLVEAVRQGLKNYHVGGKVEGVGDIDTTSIAINTLAPMIPGGSQRLMKKGTKKAGAVGKAKALDALSTVANPLRTPSAIIRDIPNVVKRAFSEEGDGLMGPVRKLLEPIKDSTGKTTGKVLGQEFFDEVLDATGSTIKRAERLKNLTGNLNKDLHNYYMKNGHRSIPAKDILNSKSFKALRASAGRGKIQKIPVKFRPAVVGQYEDFLEQLAENALHPSTADAYKNGNLHLTKARAGKFKTNEQALLAELQEKGDISLFNMWEIRKNQDTAANWLKTKANEKPTKWKDQALRQSANAYREAMIPVMEQLDPEMLRKTEMLHNLIPVYNAFREATNGIRQGGLLPRVSDWMGGVINTPWRLAAETLRKVGKQPQARNIARQGIDILQGNSKLGQHLPDNKVGKAIGKGFDAAKRSAQIADFAGRSAVSSISIAGIRDISHKSSLFPHSIVEIRAMENAVKDFVRASGDPQMGEALSKAVQSGDDKQIGQWVTLARGVYPDAFPKPITRKQSEYIDSKGKVMLAKPEDAVSLESDLKLKREAKELTLPVYQKGLKPLRLFGEITPGILDSLRGMPVLPDVIEGDEIVDESDEAKDQVEVAAGLFRNKGAY